MISVVVPLYNKAGFIRNTVASVLAQSMKDWELVVVDDGSCDAGPSIVETFVDSRIRLIRQANGGVSRARNAGIDAAHGEWIAFLDADDWLHPEYLAHICALIDDYAQVDVVATRYRSMPAAQGACLEPWPLQKSVASVELIEDLPARWLEGTTFFTGSVAVRASLLREMQPCFAPGESFGEDLDLWFRLGERGPIALSSLALTARIWVADGLSVVHAPLREAPFLHRLERRAASGASQLGAQAKSSLRFVDETRVTLARSAISAGSRIAAVALLWRARRAAGRSRWWVTLGMAVLVPGALVFHWQQWRKRRKMVL